MVKPEQFHIEFDGRGMFVPGDEVTGKVVVQTREPILCDTLSLQFCGAARVFW